VPRAPPDDGLGIACHCVQATDPRASAAGAMNWDGGGAKISPWSRRTCVASAGNGCPRRRSRQCTRRTPQSGHVESVARRSDGRCVQTQHPVPPRPNDMFTGRPRDSGRPRRTMLHALPVARGGCHEVTVLRRRVSRRGAHCGTQITGPRLRRFCRRRTTFLLEMLRETRHIGINITALPSRVAVLRRGSSVTGCR
jgi:hypothetical protein